MPSSPDAARPWAPAELTETPHRVTRAITRPNGLTLFEVADDPGLPDSVLAPARLAAESAGYAAGWAEGARAGRDSVERDAAHERDARRATEQEHRQLIAAAVAALHRAAQALEHAAVPTAGSIEDLIVSAAFELAEAVVGVVLSDDRLRGEAALRRALSLAPADEPVTIALHPDDHAVLVEDGVEELLAAFPGRSIRVVGDPTLRPGDAVATSGASTIDARLGAGLDRARRLLADPSGSGEPAQR